MLLLPYFTSSDEQILDYFWLNESSTFIHHFINFSVNIFFTFMRNLMLAHCSIGIFMKIRNIYCISQHKINFYELVQMLLHLIGYIPFKIYSRAKFRFLFRLAVNIALMIWLLDIIKIKLSVREFFFFVKKNQNKIVFI